MLVANTSLQHRKHLVRFFVLSRTEELSRPGGRLRNFWSQSPLPKAQPPLLVPSLKQETENTESSLSCPYTHWGMVKLPAASPFRRTESSPTPHPRHKPSTVTSRTSASLEQFLRTLFDGFLTNSFLKNLNFFCFVFQFLGFVLLLLFWLYSLMKYHK